RLSEVRESTEESLLCVAVGPVAVDLENREVAAPVRGVKLDRLLLLGPGRGPVHGEVALPPLERPVRAVGGLAAGDEEGKRRPVIRRTGVSERPPEPCVPLALPAARVIDAERLLDAGERRVRDAVDRAAQEDVPTKPPLRRVLDSRD